MPGASALVFAARCPGASLGTRARSQDHRASLKRDEPVRTPRPLSAAWNPINQCHACISIAHLAVARGSRHPSPAHKSAPFPPLVLPCSQVAAR